MKLVLASQGFTTEEIAKTHEELNLVDFNIIPHYMREDHKKWTNRIYWWYTRYFRKKVETVE